MIEWGGLTTLNEKGEYHSTSSLNPVKFVQKQMSHKEQVRFKWLTNNFEKNCWLKGYLKQIGKENYLSYLKELVW